MKINIMHLMRYACPGVIFVSLLSGCSFGGGSSVSSINPTQNAQSETAGSQQIILTIQPETGLPEGTRTFEVVSPTVTQPITVNLTGTASTQNIPCNLASAGVPLDVTIPDDTRLDPNEAFSKVWRLKNSGSCAWTADYAVVWYSGDDCGANRIQPILLTAQPGETVEIAVDMVAPGEPGLYSGYWMLMSDSGELFGIGPNGDSPFWVRIQVAAMNTATPSLMPTVMPTTAVLVSGKVDLLTGQSIDLDSGKLNLEGEADAILELPAEGQQRWRPLNEARFAIFGLTKPGELECRLAALSGDPILIDNLETGHFLCFRTGDGLPGWMQILNLPAGESPMQIDFTTWAVP